MDIRTKALLFGVLICLACSLEAQPSLPIPPRSASALTGSQLYQPLASLAQGAREDRIYQEVMAGNVPDFLRVTVPVSVSASVGGTTKTVTFFAAPDYVALGSDDDYVLMPMTPLLAQRLANELNCTLPTKKMVDAIYSAAPLKLRPQPIPPSGAMITVPVFYQHNDSVQALRQPAIVAHPLGTLTGGHKKDVIIANKIYNNLKTGVPKPVVIYGWHQLNGIPIQPVYNGHGETYADYSHGIRLVLQQAVVGTDTLAVSTILTDATLWPLLSDEGVIAKPYYTVATDVERDDEAQPKRFRLEQNYPNPFNPNTKIRYTLSIPSKVTISICNLLGEQVYSIAHEHFDIGAHEDEIRLEREASGVYFYTVTAESAESERVIERETKAMLCVK